MQIMKKALFILTFLLSIVVLSAQNNVYELGDITIINYGDGRLLFRENNESKTPLNGNHRIINGITSEYILSEFKDGMYNGKYQLFRYNKLTEEGEYKEGWKNGLYKEYYSEGKLKKETPYTDGKLNGVVKNYYTDGNLEKEKEYKMSIEDGIETRYDYKTREKTIDRRYKDGKLDGFQRAIIISNTGNYTQISYYEKGNPIGKFSEIYLDGTIKTLGSYNSFSNKDGEWIIRNPFENKGKKQIYSDGKLIKEEDIKNFEKFQKKQKLQIIGVN